MINFHLRKWPGVVRCSVVKCLTCNPEILDSSRTGSSVFFVGVSLGKTRESPSLVLVKPRIDTNNVNCRRDISEILLKTKIIHHSVNQSLMAAVRTQKRTFGHFTTPLDFVLKYICCKQIRYIKRKVSFQISLCGLRRLI